MLKVHNRRACFGNYFLQLFPVQSPGLIPGRLEHLSSHDDEGLDQRQSERSADSATSQPAASSLNTIELLTKNCRLCDGYLCDTSANLKLQSVSAVRVRPIKSAACLSYSKPIDLIWLN